MNYVVAIALTSTIFAVSLIYFGIKILVKANHKAGEIHVLSLEELYRQFLREVELVSRIWSELPTGADIPVRMESLLKTLFNGRSAGSLVAIRTYGAQTHINFLLSNRNPTSLFSAHITRLLESYPFLGLIKLRFEVEGRSFVVRDVSACSPANLRGGFVAVYCTANGEPYLVNDMIRFKAFTHWLIGAFQNAESKELAFMRKDDRIEARIRLHDLLIPVANLKEIAGLLERGESSQEYKSLYAQLKQNILAVEEQVLENELPSPENRTVVASEFDVISLVAEVVSSFAVVAKDRKIKFRFNAHYSKLFVMTEAVRLRRIVRNLLSNSIKYSQGGDVEIRIRRLREFCEVVVSDSGPGLPSREVDMINSGMDALLNHPRSGLLSVARCCQDLGVKISAISPTEGGTMVSLAVPLARNDCLSQGPDSLTVAIMEDQPTLRDSMCRTLTAEGINVLVVETVSKASQLAESGLINLFVIDRNFHGMDLVSELIHNQKLDLVTPFLVLSGDLSGLSAMNFTTAHPVQKPIHPADFIRLVRDFARPHDSLPAIRYSRQQTSSGDLSDPIPPLCVKAQIST